MCILVNELKKTLVYCDFKFVNVLSPIILPHFHDEFANIQVQN